MFETDPPSSGDSTEAPSREPDSSGVAAIQSRRRLLQTIAGGGTLLLAGCGQGNPNTPTSAGIQDQGTPTATSTGEDTLAHVSGQTLRAPIGDNPAETSVYTRPSLTGPLQTILNQAGKSSASVPLQRTILETGVWADGVYPGGDAQTYYNWIEEPIEISPTEVHVSIRDDARWSDGHQITGKDIACIPLHHTIQNGRPPYYADDTERPPQLSYLAIDDFDIGEQSVTYRSSEGHFDQFWELDIRRRFGVFKGPHLIPTHIEPYDVYADAVIETVRRAQQGEIDPWKEGSSDPTKRSLIQKHLMRAEYVEKFSKAENVLATGAWDPVEFRGSKEFVFEKNEHHRNADSINFDRMVLEYTSSANRERASLKANRLDYSSTTFGPPTPQSVVQSFPDNIEQLLVPGGLFTGTELGINFRRSPLKHRKVRAAIMYALDHTEIANTIHPSATVPVTNPGGDCWDATERVGQAWIDENLTTYDHDREKAASLLREAGFTREGKQWVDPDGQRFAMPLPTTNQTPRWERVVASQLSQFGIETNVNTLGGGAFGQRLENGEFPIWPGNIKTATNIAPSTLFIWFFAVFQRRVYGIYPEEQYETGEFSDSGVPQPRTEERWSVFTIEAPPIGEPDGPLQEYHPSAMALSIYTNPPVDEYRRRVKTGMWLANWYLPTFPLTKKLEQHFIDDAHWLWPKDTTSWKAFTAGEPKQRGGLFATGNIRANPENPEEGASVDE